METEVLLREENKFKEVEITGIDKPEIGDEFLNKWQDIINLIADITGVAAGLIMTINPETMEVVLKSENDNNPYKVGGSDSLGHGLYCETVIGEKEGLYIKNALKNKAWEDNPDIDLDMISYYGLPLSWPDQEAFGTICVLDDKRLSLDSNSKKLLKEFRNVIEADLRLLTKQDDLKINRKAIETAIAGIVFLNMRGEIFYANHSFLKMSGHKKPEKIYKANITPFDLIPETEFEKAKKAIEITIEKGEWQGESKAIKVSGEEIDIQISTSLVVDDDKQPICMMASFEDITERKKAEEEVKKQKDKLDFILEGTDAGTWEWNIQTGKTFFNKKWAEMLGYKLEEIEPTTIETWEKFTHPKDLKKAKKQLDKHFKGESEQYDIEIRMKHKDGHWVWMNDRGRVVSWIKENKPLKMFGIHLDITERKEREEKLEFLAVSMRNISDAVMITDTDFKIEYINDTGEKLFGYSLEELKGKTPAIFNIEENASEIQQEIYEAVSNGDIYKTKFLNKRKDGSTFICEMKATPLKNDAGEIYAHIGIQRDITKRVKKQKKLELQHQFQKNLAEISSDLLEINPANIDRILNQALEKIGRFFDVDRSYIFQFNKEKYSLSNTYEWCREGIEPQKKILQNINAERFPWSVNQLQNNKIINIKDVNNMGKNKEAEQNLLEALNLKSVVVTAMFIENKFFGFFGFDSVQKKREFSEEEIRLLKIFTDTITNAFSKHLDDKKIRKLTYKDRLTGLYNRRFFEEELERLDTKRQLPISIIIGDINGLKIINDSLGHEKGDQLLKKSARILEAATRKEDILARQGGDEFAILLPKTEKEKAEKVIARIKEQSRQTNDDELTVTIALGAAVKTDSAQNINDILRTADNSMYQNKLAESRSAKNRIIKSLLNNLEIKSYETREHAERMKKLAVEFGKELDFSNSELNRLSLLAKLHDIGKTTIDEKILKKADSLTDAEWKIMKEHPEKGYQIASSSKKFAIVADEIFTHHEKWDGSGYPKGLSGDKIPYLARIINIIDSYDVMIHDRPYSPAISKEEALAEIKSCAGNQFDPELSKKFIKMIKE